MTVRNVWILNQASPQLCRRHKRMGGGGGREGQTWEIWLMRSQMKTCHKKPAASNLIVRLLFVRISTNLGGLEKSCCFPVLGELCWTVHKHVLLFSFFWVFLSEGLLCSPLCNGSTGQGMVIGDWEMVDKMTTGGTNSATHTMRLDLRGTPVTINDCVICWPIQPLHLLIRLVFINHSWRPPTMPKFSLRPVETRFWSILGQLKSPQETPACWWVIVLMSALPPHTYLHPATRT